MISINKIRERSGLLLIIVGVAMLAFILGDLFTSKPGSTAMNVGEISGENIEAADFQRAVDLQEQAQTEAGQQIDENSREQMRNQVWNQFVRNMVLGEQFEKLGITVTKAEYDDVRFGNNILPDFKNNQNFINPATGQFDKEAVKRMFGQMQQQAPNYLKIQRDQILESRKMAKYNTLIRKGLYVNKIQAEAEYKAANDKVNMTYVVGRFAAIADSTIKPSDEELKAYFNDHKSLAKYKQQESRSIEFVTFDVKATGDDIKKVQGAVSALVEPFKASTNDSTFVANNSDTKTYQVETYTPGSADPITDSLITKGSKGTVVGPFAQGDNLKLVKIVSNGKMTEVFPRHIILKPSTTKTNAQLMLEADSLMKEIKKNNNFADVARLVGQDGTAQNGGDLEWINSESSYDKDFRAAALKLNKGEMTVIESSFGVHVIEAKDKREVDKINIASIQRSLAPSKETSNEAYTKASTFSSSNRTTDDFRKAAEAQKLNKQVAPNISPASKFIPGIQDPSQVVRWMNNAELNNVSEPFEVGNQFVVATLTLITEEGEPSFEAIKTQIEAEVIKEKKAKLIMDKIKSTNLAAVATALGETVQTANDITFNTPMLPSAGREPKVIGVAVTLPVNTVSKPIIGENGVYVIQVTSSVKAPATKDYTQSKMEVASRYTSRVDYAAFNALIENAKVKDQRYKFY